jgi:4-amino-4-deoxy-L-arabinose transferase-like glycosyltransferase
MLKKIEKYPLLSILIACLGLYFLNLESLQLSLMEARNFVVAREMLTEGNWLLTTMNGLTRYEKPPMPPWMLTPFISTMGLQDIIAYRLPTSIMASLGVFIMYFFVKDYSNDRRLALISALVLATSYYYIAIRFEAPSDTYTHVFMFAGVYCLYKYFSSVKIKVKYLVLAGLATGFSILSKGPVGPYALLLPFLPAFFLSSKYPHIKKKLKYIFIYLAIAAISGGSWYVYVRLADPSSFIEMARKETGNWSSYNVRPFYHYWSFFTQTGVWAIPALASLMYAYIKRKTSHKETYKFSWIWVIASLVLLSVIPEKKSRYVVPILIPLAISTAIYLKYIIENFHDFKDTKRKLVPYTSFILPGIAGLLFPFVILILNAEVKGSLIWYFITASLFTATGFFIIWNALRKKSGNAFILVVCLNVLAWGLGIKATEYTNQNESYRLISDFDNSQALPIYFYEKIEPEVIWEIGEISLRFEAEKAASAYPDTFYIAVETDKVDDLKDVLRKHNFNVKNESVFNRNDFTAPGKHRIRPRYVTHLLLVQKIY